MHEFNVISVKDRDYDEVGTKNHSLTDKPRELEKQQKTPSIEEKNRKDLKITMSLFLKPRRDFTRSKKMRILNHDCKCNHSSSFPAK